MQARVPEPSGRDINILLLHTSKRVCAMFEVGFVSIPDGEKKFRSVLTCSPLNAGTAATPGGSSPPASSSSEIRRSHHARVSQIWVWSLHFSGHPELFFLFVGLVVPDRQLSNVELLLRKWRTAVMSSIVRFPSVFSKRFKTCRSSPPSS